MLQYQAERECHRHKPEAPEAVLLCLASSAASLLHPCQKLMAPRHSTVPVFLHARGVFHDLLFIRAVREFFFPSLGGSTREQHTRIAFVTGQNLDKTDLLSTRELLSLLLTADRRAGFCFAGPASRLSAISSRQSTAQSAWPS